MVADEHWYLLSYDIRDDKRYRQAVKVIKGFAERLQYSVFRCKLFPKKREKIRLELSKILAPDDNILIVELCHQCVEKVKRTNNTSDWLPEPESYRVIG
ncbi:MAG: CRISPR-associated endonuclease Cas2 [Cyanobacteria bacterium]|nr:CRISPR-associated endonuclease Cas2 [Cyanobacteriota bacterium]